jgi:hypothetical protein
METMALTDSVAKVLTQVEESTGLPVHVEPDSTLPQNILAKVTMARGNIPFHQVAYHSRASEVPDYLIVYQCGFILRRYGRPTNDRLDFADSGQGQAIVRNWLVNNAKNPDLAPQSLEKRAQFLHSGLINQLRSIPVGLRVDAWIRDQFPDLHTLQEQALARQP